MNKSSLVSKLSRLKSSKDEKDVVTRIALIEQISRSLLSKEKDLSLFHDTLLFIIAHSQQSRELVAAQKALKRLIATVVKKNSNTPKFLHGSGIAGSWRTDSFSLDLFDILSSKRELCAEFQWNKDGSLGEDFDEFLQECVFTTEKDAVMYEGKNLRELLKYLRAQNGSELGGLIRAVKLKNIDPRAVDRIFDSLDLWIDWKCANNSWSRTTLRFPKNSDIKALLDVCRGTLAVRGRETDTVIYTDITSVSHCRCANGVEIAFFELAPERRLAIESYVGFVAARNRVPIAYGGAWMLGYRAEIGVNIFEEFRGGDSKELFRSIIDQYNKTYRMTEFIVQPYQFGGDNDEALKSGAFWFYYRLGFRPDDRRIGRLAEKEAQKRKNNSNYKSSIATLKKLSEKQIVLSLDKDTRSDDRKLVTQEIGYLLLKKIGESFSGDRHLAKLEAAKIWRSLPGLKSTPMPEIGLILLLFNQINKWSHTQRSNLKLLLSAKTGRSEREFVMATQRHERFRFELKRVLRGI